jgi:hypothetical protein
MCNDRKGVLTNGVLTNMVFSPTTKYSIRNKIKAFFQNSSNLRRTNHPIPGNQTQRQEKPSEKTFHNQFQGSYLHNQ